MLQNFGTRDPNVLMNASAEEVLKAFPDATLGITDPARHARAPGQVVDGKVVLAPVEQAVAGGSAVGVPLLVGYARDELSPIVDIFGFSLEWWAEKVRSRLPSGVSAESMIETYRAARGGSSRRGDSGRVRSHKALQRAISHSLPHSPTKG